MQLARLRNFGIVAHIDAGKTTVSERLLYYAGVERRMGEVHDGTATMDWMDQERERGITIVSAVTRLPWRGHELQLIDTPGHVDFTVEVERCLRVLDGALLVVDAVAGVQAQTEAVLHQSRRYALPLLALINKLDRQGADFEVALAGLGEAAELPVVAVQWPIYEDGVLLGVVDLLSEQECLAGGRHGAEPRTQALRAELQDVVAGQRDHLCSTVADGDERLTDLYLAAGRLDEATLRQELARRIAKRELIVALAGAAAKNIGMQAVLDAVVDWLPSPAQRASVRVERADGRSKAIEPDASAAPLALVYKVFHERGRALHFCRVFSGSIADGQQLQVGRSGAVERVEHVLRMHADDGERIGSAGPGELVALTGLAQARTGDTLCGLGESLVLDGLQIPEPVLQVTLECQEPAQVAALDAALAILLRDDPSLRTSRDHATGQLLLSGMGELHLEVLVGRLRDEFNLSLRVGHPQVAYREALRGVREGRTRLRGTSGPEEFELCMDWRLSPRAGAGVTWAWPGESGRPGYWEAVLKELRDAPTELYTGELGFPLAGVCLEILAVRGGAQLAQPGAWAGLAQRALREGLAGQTELHEPWVDLRVCVPDTAISVVLADLNARGATVREVEPMRGEIHAHLPLASLVSYATALRSMTQGRGEFSTLPLRYQRPDSRRIHDIRARLGISQQDSPSGP